MLSMKDTGLVSGVGLAATPQVPVKVLRGFYDEDRQAHAPGEIILVRERFARSLIANGKAERAELPQGGIVKNPGMALIGEGTSEATVPAASPNHEEKAAEPAAEKQPRQRGRRLTHED